MIPPKSCAARPRRRGLARRLLRSLGLTQSIGRFMMGFKTACGVPRGFFSPHRYAGSVRPTHYPELEEVFQAAEPEMRTVLENIDAHMDRLAAMNGPPPEPRWDQTWFSGMDGAATYAIVRQARPASIVEVGSGHSTRMLTRAVRDNMEENKKNGGQEGRIVCIDPEPRADLTDLGVRLERRLLAEADIPRFAALEAGDVAFFDGSHLLWPGSDADLMLNRIMPILKPGVLIHIHDIHLPDPYPEQWNWRGYTEQLGLGGWLAGSGADIVFSSRYALTRMGAADRLARLPLPEGALTVGGSLWLRRR